MIVVAIAAFLILIGACAAYNPVGNRMMKEGFCILMKTTSQQQLDECLLGARQEQDMRLIQEGFVTFGEMERGTRLINEAIKESIENTFARMSVVTSLDLSRSRATVAQAGMPNKGMVGEFQCATYQDALNFRCGFDEHLCSCIAQGTVLRCPCGHIHLDAVLKKTLLPRSEAGIAILTEGGLIKTKLTTSSLVSIQLQFRNQSIHRIVKDDNCSIATTTITGCFSCGKGALLTATCTSMVHKRIEATVKCPTIGVDFLECGINGVRGKINFHSTQRKIEETCSISCGTVKQEFSLQGELAEEATFDASGLRDRFAEFTQKIGEGGSFDFITGKIAAVWSTITSWIGSGIVIMVVLVIGGDPVDQFYYIKRIKFGWPENTMTWTVIGG
ncbi:unnamed protein product [Caenorhabditis sp. 36 PRJEB53466]|nr:unnamed protein product [Caenorhabditis sp. 36 PRJEB53466]